ncbi:hypothetical protein [Citrobacter sp. Igbk 16]|uniref:hypothetical protein n=1 Tax=Citrobacter sp. Igbk 16 TaxID=2963958 RepID=UPI00230494CE|nr:hypothetical protein [Citrobacter sp. Igbk 16]MDA8518977.1 hypothetical protein [Citrobacter sp. Igbk 16]
MVDEIKELNALVIKTIRELPLEDVITIFGIDREVAKVIRKIPKKKLYVLIESPVSLLSNNNAVLKEAINELKKHYQP